MADLAISVKKSITLDQYGYAHILRYVTIMPRKEIHFTNEFLSVCEDTVDLTDIKVTDSKGRNVNHECIKKSGQTVIKYLPKTTIQPDEIYIITIEYTVPGYGIKFPRLNACFLKEDFFVDEFDGCRKWTLFKL